MLLESAKIIIGFALLIYGAEILVRGASNVAKRFHIPEIIIGLTIVSIGTSMPELIITVTSALENHTDLIIGNAIGSDICNFLFILGFMSIFKPVKIDKETRKIHLPAAIISTVILLIMANGIFGTEKFFISKTKGLILLAFGIIYFAYPVFIEIKDIIKTNNKEKKKKSKKNKKEINLFKATVNIIIGIILLKYGSDFVVENATLIAEQLKIAQSIIGLTVIAIGTALPEIVTSIIAIIKKDTDMAVGNLIGSSVINSCLIIGIGAIINPFAFVPRFNIDLVFLLCITLFIWLFSIFNKKNTLTRSAGVFQVTLFIIYIVRLFMV